MLQSSNNNIKTNYYFWSNTTSLNFLNVKYEYLSNKQKKNTLLVDMKKFKNMQKLKKNLNQKCEYAVLKFLSSFKNMSRQIHV